MKKRLITGFAILICCAVSPLCFAQEETEAFRSGDWNYSRNDDGTATITQWNGEEESLAIPEELDGLKVTEIGETAFNACTGLKEVTIPESVTRIGEHAFGECAALNSVTMPDSVTEIADYAFFLCGNLEDINFPESLTRIGKKAFCASLLTSVTIPDKVESIGDWAFGSCHSLTDIDVSSGNDSFVVMNHAVVEKESMTLVCYPEGRKDEEYEIPEGVARIGNNAFSYCDSLKHITIPESVTQIGEHSFSSCRYLEEITIPKSTVEIGAYAFLNCKRLTLAVIPASVTEIGRDAFEYCNVLKLSVPEGSCAEQYAKENEIPYDYTEAS